MTIILLIFYFGMFGDLVHIDYYTLNEVVQVSELLSSKKIRLGYSEGIFNGEPPRTIIKIYEYRLSSDGSRGSRELIDITDSLEKIK